MPEQEVRLTEILNKRAAENARLAGENFLGASEDFILGNITQAKEKTDLGTGHQRLLGTIRQVVIFLDQRIAEIERELIGKLNFPEGSQIDIMIRFPEEKPEEFSGSQGDTPEEKARSVAESIARQALAEHSVSPEDYPKLRDLNLLEPTERSKHSTFLVGEASIVRFEYRDENQTHTGNLGFNEQGELVSVHRNQPEGELIYREVKTGDWRTVGLITIDRGIGEGYQITSEQGVLTIEDLNFSVRTYNVLKRSGVMDLQILLSRRKDELLALKNFGRHCFDEVLQVLASRVGIDISE